MRVAIQHQTRFRMRLEVLDPEVPNLRGPIELAISEFRGVTAVKFKPRTQCLSIEFDSKLVTSADILEWLTYFDSNPMDSLIGQDDQELTKKRAELARSVWISILGRSLTGFPRAALSLYSAYPFLKLGATSLKNRKLNAEVLDAVAIGTSLKTRDYASSSTIGLLLRLGEYLKFRTEHRAKAELIGALSREHQGAWLRQGQRETWVRVQDLQVGDQVIVRHGGMIPVDGVVVVGDALIDQSTLTGEGLPVSRRKGSHVYGGTLVTEGKIEIRALNVGDKMRASEIIRVVQAAENQKANVELRSNNLADRLVPYILSSAGIAYTLTGDPRRASSILLVDYSCALKISIPIAIKAGLADALRSGILIRGGRYMEELAQVDTIIFDKTGTLTEARPKVTDIWAAPWQDMEELIRDTACIEEHFPHPVAQAILDEAIARKLIHAEENHGEVKYLVSQGIISDLRGRRFVVGNRKFMLKNNIDLSFYDTTAGPAGSSIVYVGIDNSLAGVFIINDPIRADAAPALAALRAIGISKLILLTGDNHANAQAVAKMGFDEFHAELSPEEKMSIVKELRASGRKVAMVGDGMNDAPALSSADVGISFQHGSDLAKGAADVVILKQDLRLIAKSIKLSRQAQGRVQSNFNWTVGINSALIGAAFIGVSSPTASALLHNLTTVIVAGRSVRSYQ